MKGINYTVGLGTVLIVAGIYCFKILLSKNTRMDKEGELVRDGKSLKYKSILIISGILTITSGVWLILISLPVEIF
ncbi:MAG TPA: hypothetical protein PKD91_00365 [Bacteroidia bacterium]|nr:hypothetical protein [Bacteroidia bacterium]